MKSLRVLWLFVGMLISTSALGQTATVMPVAANTEKAEQEIKSKALLLLEQTIGAAESLKLPENRVYVFATAADLLWTHDESRARQLYRRAAAEINWSSIQTEKEAFKISNNFSLMRKVRERFLEQVAERDAIFAIELLRQTRFPVFDQVWNLPPEKKQLYSDLAKEAREDLELEKQFTVRLASQNPRRALEIARANLDKKILFIDLRLIEKLKEKDAAAASEFANEVLQKLIATDIIDAESEGRDNLGISFLAMFSAASSSGSNSSALNNGQQLQINQNNLHQLAEKCAAYFLSDDFSSDFAGRLPGALPIFKKVLPERFTALRQKAKQLAPTVIAGISTESLDQSAAQVDNTPKQFDVLSTQPDESSNLLPKKFERLEEEFDQLNKSFFYSRVSNDAEANKFLTKMRSQVCDLPGYAPRSSYFTRIFERLSESYSAPRLGPSISQLPEIKIFYGYLNSEKYAEAEQIIARQSDNNSKIWFLTSMSAYFRGKKQNEKTQQYLSEALSLVNPHPESHDEMANLSQLIEASAILAPDQAFELLDAFIPKFNEILRATALLSKYQLEPGIFRESELIFSDPRNNSHIGRQFEMLLIGLGAMKLESLAKADLNRTVNLTEKFESNDVRVAARLIILRGVLAIEKPFDLFWHDK